MPRLWTSGKRFQIETSFLFYIARIARNDNGHNLLEFYTNRITNSKMADKMAAVKQYNWP